MSRRDNDILVDDMLASCLKIVRYTAGLTYDAFSNDEKTIDAVIRNFEIIGEAANNLSDEFKDQYPQIDWHKMRGFRNRIVHDYAGVDLRMVWSIITAFLPGLTAELRNL